MRATYGRNMDVKKKLDEAGSESFVPMHYVIALDKRGRKMKKFVPVVRDLIFVRTDLPTMHSLKEQYESLRNIFIPTGEGKKLVRLNCAYLKKKKKLYLIPKLFVHSGCKFIGYKLGKMHRKLPDSLIMKLTMNKAYWAQRNFKNATKGINPHSGYGISPDERK